VVSTDCERVEFGYWIGRCPLDHSDPSSPGGDLPLAISATPIVFREIPSTLAIEARDAWFITAWQIGF
jgi:hypothetical protein